VGSLLLLPPLAPHDCCFFRRLPPATIKTKLLAIKMYTNADRQVGQVVRVVRVARRLGGGGFTLKTGGIEWNCICKLCCSFRRFAVFPSSKHYLLEVEFLV